VPALACRKSSAELNDPCYQVMPAVQRSELEIVLQGFEPASLA
jgi:hypothetical protein